MNVANERNQPIIFIYLLPETGMTTSIYEIPLTSTLTQWYSETQCEQQKSTKLELHPQRVCYLVRGQNSAVDKVTRNGLRQCRTE